ncbi:uncharacterized protein BO87DRAFT_181771 [Aspergillus neoniger CBS 115656]|uniref:Uncharacterized protein n=1 Tax=Aspergillus neoniger (strain CBS 115656) TaxID=1448310 RepID=A0A318YW21_ASPNB|nr:hypothetical protein BO87DRAFT_181771 [Aspergillus neoniger CBS 115656]PYH29402.1 hypothetical protein BO87DRAFT_181771 [Aspergillus neoniger CBS 115656]
MTWSLTCFWTTSRPFPPYLLITLHFLYKCQLCCLIVFIPVIHSTTLVFCLIISSVSLCRGLYRHTRHVIAEYEYWLEVVNYGVVVLGCEQPGWWVVLVGQIVKIFSSKE